MADGFILPKAMWRVSLDSQDLTASLSPRLVSLTLRESRGDEADQVDIVVSDHDGQVQIPRSGVILKVELGWQRGTGLPIGLADKGTYKVDEVKYTGGPDRLIVRARSADFTDALRKRRERSFVGKSVGTIVKAIAADNKLKANIQAALATKTIPALGSGAVSDAALLKALGRRFDAVATIKAGTLIFAPIGTGKNASGQAFPVETIDRSQTDPKFDYERIERDNYSGVEAVWHNKATGQRETVSVGAGGSSKAKRLRKVYSSKVDAQAAAQAEFNRKARAKAKLSLTLAYGRPDLFPDCPVTVTGFKVEIDAQKWTVAEATHKMDGQGGLTSTLNLEAIG